MAVDSKNPLPTRFGFLLLEDFTLISMSSAVEPLRMANRIMNEAIYEWRTISETGGPVTASDGLSVNVDYAMTDTQAAVGLDAVIVCSGIDVERSTTEPVVRWLRTMSSSGPALGAICTGSYVLGKANLLDGYRCSVHWENIASVTDLFPYATVTRGIYTIDRNRYTSSGGTAPVDMMLHFIARRCGPEVSAGVAEQFVHDRVRAAGDQQRVPLKHTVGNQSDKLIMAVELMEANIREPINQSELASYVDLSRRQLQRLFHRFLHCTPSRYYLQIRLARARELLHQTSMNLVEISSLTGFVSSSHFSKSYKNHYGYSPSEERRRVQAQANATRSTAN